MKGAYIDAPFKSNAVGYYSMTRFSDLTSTFTIYDIFYNSIVTKFCGLNVSLCFNVFDSNIGLTPSVFQRGTSDYKNKVKFLEGHILDLFCIRLSNASTFCKSYAKLYSDAKHLKTIE